MTLSGCITALATPFLEDGALDLDAWRRLLLRQRQAGIQGVVVAGSTGEAAALTDEEYSRLLAIAVEMLGGAVPILAGTGHMNTAKTVAQTRLAAVAGAAFALVVTPAYVRPTQAGLLAHFRAVADEGGLPVVLYNVPSRTGCDLLPSTVAELVGHPRIVGIKEAVSDPARLQALLALRKDGFAVLGGDDASACDWLLAGADGLVSVGSNVLPASFRRLCDQARAGATGAAHAIDHSLGEYHAFLGVEPNPIPVKALLQRLGYGQGLRLPLLPLSGMHADLADRLAAQVAGLEESSVRETLAA